MNYKINFRYLVAGHIIVLVLLLLVLNFFNSGRDGFLKGVLLAVGLSLVVQVVVYNFKPTWFDDKTKPS